MNIQSMCFEWRGNGFGDPCDRCKEENAEYRISGEELPGVDGTYCDKCHKIVCKGASDHYAGESKKQAKNFKSTVLFRRHGQWSNDEMNLLYKGLDVDDVWFDPHKVEYLVVKGHHSEELVRQALAQASLSYEVIHIVGIDDERLPFPPF